MKWSAKALYILVGCRIDYAGRPSALRSDHTHNNVVVRAPSNNRQRTSRRARCHCTAMFVEQGSTILNVYGRSLRSAVGTSLHFPYS
jgi:chaperone required for assembly of F1-ATPase